MGLFKRNKSGLDFVSPTPKGGWAKLVKLTSGVEVVSKTPYPYKTSNPQERSYPSLEDAEELRPIPQRPGPLYELSPQIFETYCASWAKWLGFGDATVTRYTQDGGIDIEASNMVAQVKFQELPVAVGPIRELNGVRGSCENVLFFSLNGFTTGAIKQAENLGVRLFVVKPFEGDIHEL